MNSLRTSPTHSAPDPAAAVVLRPRATDDDIRIVSATPGGEPANQLSEGPALSHDGRWVAFSSCADNLVTDDRNEAEDVFVHDTRTGQIERVSVHADGSEMHASSSVPAISADGRCVAFASMASSASLDPVGRVQVFARDRQAGTTECISLGPDGKPGNDDSFEPAISADGRWVTFLSRASNLVQHDTNARVDVFLHDRQTHRTTRVNVGPHGEQDRHQASHPTVSADGRFVAFESDATDLSRNDRKYPHRVYVHDCQSGTTVCIGPLQRDAGSQAAMSADGRWVALQVGTPVNNGVTRTGIDVGVAPDAAHPEMADCIARGMLDDARREQQTPGTITVGADYVEMDGVKAPVRRR